MKVVVVVRDYEASEYVSVSVPQCKCGSPNCRGGLLGFEHRSELIKAQYGQYYADYLK